MWIFPIAQLFNSHCVIWIPGIDMKVLLTFGYGPEIYMFEWKNNLMTKISSDKYAQKLLTDHHFGSRTSVHELPL